MNLNEAAEIANSTTTVANFDEQVLAKERLLVQMLDELDPTPISEGWFRENGWKQTEFLENKCWYKNGSSLSFSDYHKSWLFAHPRNNSTTTHAALTTLGELRTLLRLMGRGE